jgi:hypothetical protein
MRADYTAGYVNVSAANQHKYDGASRDRDEFSAKLKAKKAKAAAAMDKSGKFGRTTIDLAKVPKFTKIITTPEQKAEIAELEAKVAAQRAKSIQTNMLVVYEGRLAEAKARCTQYNGNGKRRFRNGCIDRKDKFRIYMANRDATVEFDPTEDVNTRIAWETLQDVGFDQKDLRKMKTHFDYVDFDGTGDIDFAEMIAMVGILPCDLIEAIFQMFDLDNNGNDVVCAAPLPYMHYKCAFQE